MATKKKPAPKPKKKSSDSFKELILDNRTGKVREATAADKRKADAPAAARRKKAEGNLRRQMNMDRMVMTPTAFKRKWGKK